jgi:hypothetical protein
MAIGPEYNGPSSRHVGKLGPERMLPLVVHERKVTGLLILEWIRHDLLLLTSVRLR